MFTQKLDARFRPLLVAISAIYTALAICAVVNAQTSPGWVSPLLGLGIAFWIGAGAMGLAQGYRPFARSLQGRRSAAGGKH